MSGFFENLGRRLGRAAAPIVCKSKWVWDSVTGTEEEALRAEVSFGSALALEVRRASQPANDPALSDLLQTICARLTACLRDRRRSFRCEAVQDEFLNATALPGGFIFVSRALADFCGRSADELAFVVGHEMAHVIREHAWNRMMKNAASSVLSQAVSVVAARAGPAAGWLCRNGIELLHSAYSQDDEQEADELGLRLAVAAGYSGDAAVALLQRIGQARPEAAALGRYLASHPPAAERSARLATFLRRMRTAPPR